MLPKLRNTFAEISLAAIERNFKVLKAEFGGGMLAPMVKADGYGHGDIEVARVCEGLGARFLGVALIEEGIKLRQAGIKTPILTFSHFDSVGAEAIVRYRLTPVVSQFEQIKKLRNVVHEQASYPVHVKFNTGMQRLGFEPEAATEMSEQIEKDFFLKLEGVCTHFSSGEEFPLPEASTHEQIKIFSDIMIAVKKKIQSPLIVHTHNSASVLSHVTPRLDMARPGIALYGALPKLYRDHKNFSKLLEPVMAIKSFIGFMHKVKKGGKVSYGGTWEAKKDSIIAVVPIGYSDGIPRSLSNKGFVLIRGERCPQVGLICMDYLMVDVTALSEKKSSAVLGDEVVLIGKQENESIRVEEVAELAGTIPYEILTGIQPRLARIYLH